MWHPRMAEFDSRMKMLFDEVDGYLEERYGELYAPHPARPERGETSNPEADGLFNIGASFTPGYGSESGRGYLIDVAMATLDKVDDETRLAIRKAAADRIKELLPVYFPERKLIVNRDGNHFKIQGDFSLGEI